MRRAYLLIILLTVAAVGLGLWADLTQRSVARDYLHQTESLRQQVKAGEMEAAEEAEASIHARWDKDSRWLNCMIPSPHPGGVHRLSTAVHRPGNGLGGRKHEGPGSASGCLYGHRPERFPPPLQCAVISGRW